MKGNAFFLILDTNPSLKLAQTRFSVPVEEPASTQGWDGSLAQPVGRVWEQWLWTAFVLPEPGIMATFGGGEVKISSHWFGSKYGFRSSNYHIILLARNHACPLQHLPSLFRKIKRGKIKILKHLKCSYLRWWHTTQLPASQVLQPCANNDSQHSHYTVSLIYVFSPSRPGCQKEGEEEG